MGLYPHVLGQVKEWLIVGLREMIGVPHAVLCLINFNLLCDRGQQGGVPKPTENDHFQVFLAVWVLFLKRLSRLRSGVY